MTPISTHTPADFEVWKRHFVPGWHWPRTGFAARKLPPWICPGGDCKGNSHPLPGRERP